MKQIILIYLYYDQFTGFENVDSNDIVVVDGKTYAEARLSIENLKSGEEKGPITIIVRARQFFSGFHDINEFGDLIHITKIAPREQLISKLHIQLPNNLTDTDLINLGIKGPDDIVGINTSVFSQEDFDNTLLNKAFECSLFQSKLECDFDTWLVDILDFFHSNTTPQLGGWKITYVSELVQEKIRSALIRFGESDLYHFLVDLMQLVTEDQARSYLNQLAVRYWIRNYPKPARKVIIDNLTSSVGQWRDVKSENIVFNAITNWSESFYNQRDNPLIDQVESVLQVLYQTDFIDDEDINKFIAQTSGRFEVEFRASEERLVKLLLNNYKQGGIDDVRPLFSMLFEELNKHFEKLSQKTENISRVSNWIKALLEFMEGVVYLQEAAPKNWTDWLATYELIIKVKRLKKSIIETIPSNYIDLVKEIKSKFSVIDEKLNAGYSDWLVLEYPRIIQGVIDKPQLVLNSARLALDYIDKGDIVIFLVLDALDWELWKNLRSEFAQNGLVIQGDEAGLAIIPTITEFSRRAIFGGLTSRNLANFIDDMYGKEISPQEEFKLLARALGYLGRISQIKLHPDNKHIQLLANELVYVNGNEKDFQQALQLQAKCYAFVYIEIDSHIHVSKLEETKLKQAAQQWLSDLVNGIVSGIKQNPSLNNSPNIKIIVVSDHGFIDVTEFKLAEIDRSLSGSLDLERHGRLAIVRCPSIENIEVASSLIKEFSQKQLGSWQIIWRGQSESYGLTASSPTEGEIVAWLMPRLSKYVMKGKGNYAHGGLSMYETIVPLSVLAKGTPTVDIPVITITGELYSEEPGNIYIALLNRNDRPFNDLVINIPELDIGDLSAGYIEAGSLKKVPTSVTPSKSGDFSIHIYLEGEVSGIRKNFEYTRILSVQPGRRERMRLSTQRNIDGENW